MSVTAGVKQYLTGFMLFWLRASISVFQTAGRSFLVRDFLLSVLEAAATHTSRKTPPYGVNMNRQNHRLGDDSSFLAIYPPATRLWLTITRKIIARCPRRETAVGRMRKNSNEE